MDLVVDGLVPEPAAQLALDEALVRSDPLTPLLRLWRNTPAVVLGRFQDVAREVALDTCAYDGVAVVRRASGGGTVVHDLGTLNVSLILPGRVLDAGTRLADLLVAALARFDVRADRASRGLFVANRKLAGFAVLQTLGGTLAHASLLVETAAATVGRYLLPAPQVPDRRDSHRAVVASLREHGIDADVESTAAAVRAVAGPGLRWRPLAAHERAMHQRLLMRRYHDPRWHLTGQAEEAPWTTPPVSSSTARWS